MGRGELPGVNFPIQLELKSSNYMVVRINNKYAGGGCWRKNGKWSPLAGRI